MNPIYLLKRFFVNKLNALQIEQIDTQILKYAAYYPKNNKINLLKIFPKAKDYFCIVVKTKKQLTT